MIRRLLPYSLAALVLVAGFASLHQYNVTWDEGVGDLFFGQRYLSYFTSFDAKYLEFMADPYPAGYTPDLRNSPFRWRPWEHYPVASTLATISSRVFTSLGLLDPFDGYHAFDLLFGAVFLVFFYRLLEETAGVLPALAATLLLFLSPRVFGDLMANVKDFSEMVFFSVTAAAFAIAIERRSPRLLILAGGLLGLALGTKANALFIPPIVILYLFLRRIRDWRLVAWVLGAFLIGVAVFFAVWPYLWHNPTDALFRNLRYIALRKNETPQWQTSNPFAMIALTMPPAFVLAFGIGLVPLARRVRSREPLALMLVALLAVVGARLALPAAVNFDGIRHFLELFPAMAAVGGMGVAFLSDGISRHVQRPALVATLLLAIFIGPIAVAEAHVHPFETAYWNMFAGGIEGAMHSQIPQAGDYWAGSYRLGLQWLNEHAEQNALLAVPIAEHTVRIVAPYRLRPDITLIHITTPSNAKVKRDVLDRFYAASRTRPAYVMFVFRQDWANEVVFDSVRDFQPVAVWRVDGAPLLAIFRVILK
jgi:MFS family permease